MTTRKPKPSRPQEIDQAVKKFRAASRAALAKKEIVQFRLETSDLNKLYQVCALKKKPVGTLVREWVLEHTDRELAQRQKANRTELDIADLSRQLNFMREQFERIEETIIRHGNKRRSKSA